MPNLTIFLTAIRPANTLVDNFVHVVNGFLRKISACLSEMMFLSGGQKVTFYSRMWQQQGKHLKSNAQIASLAVILICCRLFPLHYNFKSECLQLLLPGSHCLPVLVCSQGLPIPSLSKFYSITREDSFNLLVLLKKEIPSCSLRGKEIRKRQTPGTCQ